MWINIFNINVFLRKDNIYTVSNSCLLKTRRKNKLQYIFLRNKTPANKFEIAQKQTICVKIFQVIFYFVCEKNLQFRNGPDSARYIIWVLTCFRLVFGESKRPSFRIKIPIKNKNKGTYFDPGNWKQRTFRLKSH